jgi:predicted TPR repeat methyltransferase
MLHGSDKVEKYLKKAMRESESGHWAEAQSLCKKAIKLQPGNAEANLILGDTYNRQHNYNKALKHLVLASDLAPNSAVVQNALGNTYRDMGDYDKALARYQRALSINPSWADTHFNLGKLYRKSGRFHEAAMHLRKAVAINPQWAQAHDTLARLLEAQGKTDEAIEHFRQAVALDGTNLSACHHLAALTGETPEAPPRSYLMEIFDAHAEHFDSYLVDVLGYQGPQLLRKALDSVAGRPARFANGIDLGCGTGLSGQAFRDVCERLSGVDLAPRMIVEAGKRQVYDELLTGDVVECLCRSGQKYDLYISADLFIYMGNLEAIFACMAERAADGALLVFSTECGGQQDYFLRPSGRYAHSQAYIERLAAQHGFDIVAQEAGDLRKEGGEWVGGNFYVLKKIGQG